MAALIITSVLMLLLAAPVSYALQDDRPKHVTRFSEITNKEQPLKDRYVYTSAVPDLTHMVTTKSGETTYYWIPLPQYGDNVVVRTEGPAFLQAYYKAADLNLDSSARQGNFYGKLTSISGQSGSDDVLKALESKGITLDKEKAMVLLQGEEPQAYRPMVPVAGVIVIFWGLAAVGLYNVVRRRHPRRKQARLRPLQG